MCAFDTLTEVYTRQFLLEAINRELKKAIYEHGEMVIAILDIDNFKSVNDNYGHQDGDRVLKKIANTINECLRPEDIIGRYGGEEFIIVLPNITIDSSIHIIERIRKMVANIDYPCISDQLKVTASFGIAGYNNREIISVAELIFEADKALIMAKKTGKNKVWLHEHYI